MGSGWDTSALLQTGCLARRTTVRICVLVTHFRPLAPPTPSAEKTARPYNAAYPYFKYIAQTTNGFRSNYNGLQVTLDCRNYHGLSFITPIPMATLSTIGQRAHRRRRRWPTRPTHNISTETATMDVRHRLRFSPTYAIPGIKSPGQMLEGWQISAIWSLADGFAWSPDDQARMIGAVPAKTAIGHSEPEQRRVAELELHWS